jgi:tetrahydromethanopterin S-methyltransferase subunit G
MGYCLNTVANFISSNFDFPSAENLSILGDMLPASNEVFNLGSDDMKWKDLYLSGETIYLGKSKITNDASSGISFRDESNNTINLTVSSISIQDPLQQNKKVTIQVDSDENVSNYVLNTSNSISTRITNIDTNVSNYVLNTSNSISTRITNIDTNISNHVVNTSNNISIRITNIDTNVSNYVVNTSNEISTRITNIDTNVSNYVVNTSNEISTRITNIDTSVSNYVVNTSNEISTRLTNIDTNVSNYIKNTSNNISTRLTNIDTNVSNYVVNTSNEISKRITNVVDALDTGLLFETILVEQGIYIPLFIDKLSMKTRISSENLEFVHTFDVSISLDKNSLYHIVLFIVYNEDKSFKEIDYNVMFSYYSIDDIVISDTYIEFKTIDLKIIYLPDNFSFWIRVENDINPKVNIISR